MFENSPSICYIFFAIDDVIMTSVNTYMSMMGFRTEDKYLIKSLRENKKYEAKQTASSEPASVMEFGTNQLQTSSEQAPNQLA